MLFSSAVFILYFLPAVLFCNYVLFRKNRTLQNIFLLFASLFFYAWGEPVFVLVMLASICANWLLGLMLARSVRHRKLFLCLDIVFNLSILFVFKYLNFTGDILKGLFGTDPGIPRIALPIGISFFTFQAMSYVIDVYRGKGEVQKNILYVGLYISFFPQLIAGPIVRYETIADQIRNRVETADGVMDGFARFIIGLAKKVLLANSFSVLADQTFGAVKSGRPVSVLLAWLGAIAYTLQIYYDFSGYSDMAIGLGRMFGFQFLENFDHPYISASVTEFWRRWHISLGTWFRDYLYIPMGGNRCGKGGNLLNLFTVWFLTGLWHGANFTFIVWGLMYFVLLVFERETGFLNRKGGTLFRWAYTMFFVVLGWVIFRSDSLGEAVRYLGCQFGLAGNAFADANFAAWLSQNAILLGAGIIGSAPVFRRLAEKTRGNQLADWARVIALAVLFVLSLASLVSGSFNPFIYFNF